MENSGVFDTKVSFSWKYGGYYAYCHVRDFFLGERKKAEDVKYLDAINTIVSSDDINEANLATCKELLRLQRISDNTKARNRLEKWCTWLISSYLLAVCVVLYDAYSDVPVFRHLSLSENIMIAILSTTTANVIGLLIIVLRGHFLNKKDNNEE